MEKRELKKIELKDFSLSQGASLFGIADVKDIKQEFKFSSEILKDLDYAISIGLRLSDAILEDIVDHPTKIYFHHYRQANAELDRIAFKVTNFIQGAGYKALPIPASQLLDWDKQTAHLSHKKIGELAGLGFIGRNNLLVNPELGSRFRLVTVLTNFSLEPDKKIELDCGECRDCIKACPANAIKDKKEDFEHITCYEKLKEFKNKGYVGQFICGVCVKMCGGSKWTRKQ